MTIILPDALGRLAKNACTRLKGVAGKHQMIWAGRGMDSQVSG
jgi:hypothetical protein